MTMRGWTMLLFGAALLLCACDDGEKTTYYDTGVVFDFDAAAGTDADAVVPDAEGTMPEAESAVDSDMTDTAVSDADTADIPDDDAILSDEVVPEVEAPVDVDAVVTDDAMVVDGDVTVTDDTAPDIDVAAGCPSDMAEIGNICVDRYEASRGNATADNAGDDETIARSVPGVLPWMVNPMNDAALATFKTACVAAGKRLCSVGEWTAACEGPEKRIYHFGNTYDRETCNNVDVFCDDHCAANAIDPCSTAANCGYTYNCFHVVPTASFPNCTAGDGLFDVNGNVWEAVDNGFGGFVIKGGAFNCASAADRLKCSFAAGWTDLYAGFRCCKEKGSP